MVDKYFNCFSYQKRYEERKSRDANGHSERAPLVKYFRLLVDNWDLNMTFRRCASKMSCQTILKFSGEEKKCTFFYDNETQDYEIRYK